MTRRTAGFMHWDSVDLSSETDFYNMAININTKELLELLECTPASQNIMLSGKHGIGIGIDREAEEQSS